VCERWGTEGGALGERVGCVCLNRTSSLGSGCKIKAAAERRAAAHAPKQRFKTHELQHLAVACRLDPPLQRSTPYPPPHPQATNPARTCDTFIATSGLTVSLLTAPPPRWRRPSHAMSSSRKNTPSTCCRLPPRARRAPLPDAMVVTKALLGVCVCVCGGRWVG